LAKPGVCGYNEARKQAGFGSARSVITFPPIPPRWRGGNPAERERRDGRTMTRGFTVFLLTALAVPPGAAAKEPGPGSPIVREADGSTTVQAIRLTEPLRVDGRLDDDVYSTIPSIDAFIQTMPRSGAEPSERTEAWVMFDDRGIYISARCWDSAPPDQWTANEIRRDSNQLAQNDNFGVMLDTFHDRRNGYAFYANPLGAMSEYAISDEGNINRDWNPVWDVRTGRFEGGWTIEMAIPFKSLRYVSGHDQIWGLQLRRTLRRRNEFVHITPLPLSAGGSQGLIRVSGGATLVGLDLPTASKNLEIKPYAISGVTTDRRATPPVAGHADGDLGVDAKIGITANLTADLTYNTDFAQVEVDEQQVNLTRFSLVFPEKREFFLEGRGVFDFAAGGPGGNNVPRLFYSRRIGLEAGRAVPVDVGGRITGKVGGFGLGVLNIRTGVDEAVTAPATNFTVLRVKRDIFRRSSIGAMFTNRSHSTRADGGSNQAFGADAGFSFFQDLDLRGYYARTRTPGLDGDDSSYMGQVDYGGDRYGARLEYLHVGDEFNPEVGFLRRRDFDRTFGLLRFSPRPRSSRLVRRYLWEATFEYLENGAGALETRRETGRFNVEFENSDRFTVEAGRSYELLTDPFEVGRDVTIGRGGYTFGDVEVSYDFGEQRPVSGAVAVQRGSFYDGSITVLAYRNARLSLTPRLSVEPSVSINRIDLPAGGFTTQVLRARTTYGFSPRMLASGLVQFSSSDEALSTNLRFRWEYLPGSELFVVYTDERDTFGVRPPELKNRSFVVKATRLLRF
jgi:hypothetical protein